MTAYIRSMSKEGRDHYIPVFYQSPWTGDDDLLCQYSRPYKEVLHKRVAPKATGFVHGLNTVPHLPPERSRYVEIEHLQKLDHQASLALQKIFDQSPGDITLDAPSTIAWIVFVHSLMLRSPEMLKVMGRKFEQKRAEFAAMSIDTASMVDESGVQHTVKVGQRTVLPQELLPGFLASHLVIRSIAEMRWTTRSTASADHTMLTSDRPVIMTNGLAQPDGHLVIPIAPRLLFLATRSDAPYRAIAAMSDDQLVFAVNSKVSEQAIDYVYGVDDKQLRFVANRLGKRVQSTPLG